METVNNLSEEQLHACAVFMNRGHLGGFADRLADAWFYADSGNRKRIESSFPDLFWKAHKQLCWSDPLYPKDAP